jgi:hypothetical protein
MSGHQMPTEPPAMQLWFDRIFVLLVISILISGIMFNLWGIIDAFSIPLVKP